MPALDEKDWVGLLRMVFAPGPADQRLAILIDVPDARVPDTEAWADRRRLACEWRATLERAASELGLEPVELFAYANVGSNNADLPAVLHRLPAGGDAGTLDAARLETAGEAVALDRVLASTDLILLPTQFSATAPMKLLAKEHGYRAATMPGFSRAMTGALRIDFDEVNRRLDWLKRKLDAASAARARFRVDGDAVDEVDFDLRFRRATASGGLLRTRGSAGNLPSGETYIVPYEGEGEPSRTRGVLPVQFPEGLVRYPIDGNRARSVLGSGAVAREEAGRLEAEPAYGNIAELGFGVLRDLGIEPVGEILLDEKLGFHVAFGRSDHFGGIVGAAAFRDPRRVVHIDRIYIPETQPRIVVEEVRLIFDGATDEVLIAGGRYTGGWETDGSGAGG